MKLFSLKKIKPNPSNPRVIRDEQYARLLASILRDPEFLSKRPVVYADNVILGGNMRYRALLEATKDAEFRERIGTKKEGEVPASWVLDASEFTEEQRRRFVIVDNAPDGMSGDWDWDVLANEWGDIDLCDLGMDVPEVEEISLDESQDSLEPPLKLSDRFGLPPFSVLNSREGWWQNRKRAWLALGIKSELGRGENRYSSTPPTNRNKK